MQKHLLIAGTGRTGTSLLVRILDACGFETEISRRHGAVVWDENANAGIESIPIVGDDHPYVVKSPWSYQFIRELLARPDIKLDGVLLPVRELNQAAASRVILELRDRYEHNKVFASQVEDTWRDWGTTAGGVTYSLEPLDQARILAHSLHRIIESLLDHEIPIHFLKFPKFAEDIEYLYRRLMPVFPNKLSFAEFSERVSSVIEISRIRTGRELSVTQPQNIPAGERPISYDAVELPSFETLDQIALKRELRSTVGALERTKAERTELLTKQTDLIAQRDALEAERTELLTKQTDLIAQRDALEAERTELLTKQTDLIAQRDALEAERTKLELRLVDLVAEHELAIAKVDHLINSTSWKLTQSMRTVVGFVRNRW